LVHIDAIARAQIQPLRRELEGLWSARRGNYRVIVEIDEPLHRVVGLRIEHRADVYRPR
jgi:mRNA interferase RelE/StbE